MPIVAETKDTVHINAPHSAIVAVEGSQALSIERIPHVGLCIFGAREDQVAFTVVPDLCDRPLMAVEHNRLLQSHNIHSVILTDMAHCDCIIEVI